jgi:predicted ribonuclease YlaK
VNQFVYLEPKNGEAPFYGQVKQLNGKTAVLQTLRDFSHSKNSVWGITARNREQNFALNLLMNPECDFVTLLGQAGTGKTLLALAAGPGAGARDQAVQRDHRHPRHGAGGRRHRLPAGYRGRERCRRGWAPSTTTSKC